MDSETGIVETENDWVPGPPLEVTFPWPKVLRVLYKKASKWATWRDAVPNGVEPKRVAGEQPGRTFLEIRNENDAGGQTVYLAPTAGQSQSENSGYPVAAQGKVTFDHTSEVWAWTPQGTTAALVLMSEYDASGSE